MSEPRLLRVTTSAGVREKRLLAVLEGRDPRDPRLRAAVEDAQVAGSLELSGFAVTPPEIASARAGGAAVPEVQGLLRALRAVDPSAPLDVDRLRAWHAAATGTTGALRSAERARDGGPPPAPARFVDLRLRTLEQWLGVESGRELTPFQQGALAMARIVEILPWDEGNGRVARLAASHLMVRAGARPPVLRGADRERLRETLQAAFQLHTEPLCALLQEASERALDVMIAAVEAGVLTRAPE